MKIALIIVAVLVAIVLVVVAVGYSLPVKHRAVREARFNHVPQRIFAVITDVKAFPSWRSSVKTVEELPESEGKLQFREIGSDGSILYRVEWSEPNRQLVTRIADPSLPFGGSWTYDLIPDGGQTLLRITEDGEVYNPVFRLVSRFIMGHTSTIDRYLKDLSNHLGESAEARKD